jgi:YHS domain-containing protein
MKRLVNAVLIAGLAVPFMAAQDKKVAPKTEKPVPKEAVDPVCGMTVDPKTSDKADYKGQTYYFCSLDDKRAFEKAPEKYLAKDTKKK